MKQENPILTKLKQVQIDIELMLAEQDKAQAEELNHMQAFHYKVEGMREQESFLGGLLIGVTGTLLTIGIITAIYKHL